MSDISIFEKVAARELTPEQAARQMAEGDRLAREARRPRWAPPRLWMMLSLVATVLLALVGIERHTT